MEHVKIDKEPALDESSPPIEPIKKRRVGVITLVSCAVVIGLNFALYLYTR